MLLLRGVSYRADALENEKGTVKERRGLFAADCEPLALSSVIENPALQHQTLTLQPPSLSVLSGACMWCDLAHDGCSVAC